MAQVVLFDDAQLSALRRAINQIMESTGDLTRDEVVRAVFAVACENGEFDLVRLVRMARESLALRNKPTVVKREIARRPNGRKSPRRLTQR